METIWPNLLINASVVILLWGLVWQSNRQRLDLLQAGLERKVPADYCQLQHHGLAEDLREIKKSQEKMAQNLEEIRLQLARENGRRHAEETI